MRQRASEAVETPDNERIADGKGVIPADHKHVARAAVGRILVYRLKKLPLAYPVLSPAIAEEIKNAARTLAE